VASFIFDSAKGRWVEKFLLPVGGDNIVVVLLQSSGLQADATLNNHTSLSQLLAAGNTEATFTNYSRKVLAAADLSVSVNTGTGVTTVDAVDQVWNAAGGALNNTLGAICTCYRPTSGSLDSAILLLTKHDFATTTTGGALTAQVPSIGTVT
jgi:hypothetical protein